MDAAPWRPDPRLPRHAWIPFGIGLLLFALTRWVPGIDWATPDTDLFLLDQGFVEALREHPQRYSVLEPNHHHAFGAHTLSRMALAQVARITGDSHRAGLWLSLSGLLACIAAMFPLCRGVLPIRGFAMVTVAALAGVGALREGFSPDPSQAIGMALLAWGVALFVSALHRNLPLRILLSAVLVALAGYVRIELSLIWILLAIYLLVLRFSTARQGNEDFPYVACALAGLLVVALFLWPQFHRNILLTGTPILPGGDAEYILGAAAPVTGPESGSLPKRFGQGLVMLATGSTGVGIFLGMLWPIGLAISTKINRHRAAPYFWLPFLGTWLLLLTLLSPVTGEQSFHECLRMSVPLFLPFALLVPVYAFFQWVQAHPRSPAVSWTWWGLAAAAYLLALLPGLLRGPSANPSASPAGDQALLGMFAQSDEFRESRILTDRPGLFVAAGKRGVYGLQGETDWEILGKKYANGMYRMEELIPYLRGAGISLLHLSDIDSPLDTTLKLGAGGPLCEPVEGVSPPHRLFRLRWP